LGVKAYTSTDLEMSVEEAHKCVSRVIRQFKWPIQLDNQTQILVQVPPPGGTFNMKWYLPIQIDIEDGASFTRIHFEVDTRVGWSRIGHVGRYATGLVGQLKNAVENEAEAQDNRFDPVTELEKIAK